MSLGSVKSQDTIRINRPVDPIEKIKSDYMFFVKEVKSDSLDWKTAQASYYNPNKIKGGNKGNGLSGRKIKSGSIALGSSFTRKLLKKDIVIFIQVKDCIIVTPYGKGIFRVDDGMANRYNSKDNKYYIDFFHKDLSIKQKQLGRFKIQFKILKIVKPDNDTLSLSVFLLEV